MLRQQLSVNGRLARSFSHDDQTEHYGISLLRRSAIEAAVHLYGSHGLLEAHSMLCKALAGDTYAEVP